jgi:hypothetical protein
MRTLKIGDKVEVDMVANCFVEGKVLSLPVDAQDTWTIQDEHETHFVYPTGLVITRKNDESET